MFWLLEARMWWGVPLTCPPRWKLHHESPRIGPGTQEEPGEGQSARSPSGVSSLIPPPQPYPPAAKPVMTLPSRSVLLLITANPGINLITHSSPRGWGSDAPVRSRVPRLLGTDPPRSQALPGVPCPPRPPCPERPLLIPSRYRVPARSHGDQCPAPWLLATCRTWFGQLSVRPGSGVAGEAYPRLAGGSLRS